MQDWYVQKRQAVEEAFATGRRLSETVQSILSPSGKYALEIARYHIRPNCWDYSRGIVRLVETGEQIADVKRNFGHFPYSWAEGHLSGHDYLIAGEDYQGQTVVELNTGRRVDHVPDIAEKGFGFCWAAHYPSPDGRVFFVDGCVWAAPYELVLFDFHQPMSLPYREVKRWPIDEVQGYRPDGSFVFEYVVGVRKSDGKRLDEMTEGELETFEAAAGYLEQCGEMRVQVTWHPNGPEEETAL